MSYHDDRDRMSGILWGVLLIAFGTAYLLHRAGILPGEPWTTWWPLFVIAGGIARLATARRAKHIGDGVLWLGLGAWFEIATHDWHGLDWSNSWPLSFIAIGLSMVARAIAASFMGDTRWPARERGAYDVREEDRHDR